MIDLQQKPLQAPAREKSGGASSAARALRGKPSYPRSSGPPIPSCKPWLLFPSQPLQRFLSTSPETASFYKDKTTNEAATA